MPVFYYTCLALAAYFIYKFIIKNYMIYQKYKSKLGSKVEFMVYPLLGNYGILKRSFQNHSDSLWEFKNIQRTKPECKAIIVFDGFNISILIIDTLYQKIFLQSHNSFSKVEGPFGSHKIVSEGMFIQEGKTWSRQRAFLSSSFHYDALKSRVPAIKEIAKEYLSVLPSNSTPISIIEELQNVTSEVIIQTFFGENLRNKVINGKIPSKEISNLIADGFNHKITSLFYFLKLLIFGQEKASFVLNTKFEKTS